MSSAQGNESQITFADYLSHHLTFWTVGEEGSFWRWNLDSLIVSFGIGGFLAFFLYWQARKAKNNKTGVPTSFQVVVEMFVEWINGATKSFIHGNVSFFAPLAGVTFLWILAMNLVDFIPVDYIPKLASLITGDHHQLFRPLPTADANVTFGIDLGIFIVIVAAGFKSKGLGYYKNFTDHPLPAKAARPINLFLEVIGFFSEFLSLSLRLFGNMFAGEVIYVLIAVLYGIGFVFALLAIPVSFLWSLLHVLIVCLQAYIFMTLTILYLSKAWNKDH